MKAKLNAVLYEPTEIRPRVVLPINELTINHQECLCFTQRTQRSPQKALIIHRSYLLIIRFLSLRLSLLITPFNPQKPRLYRAQIPLTRFAEDKLADEIQIYVLFR